MNKNEKRCLWLIMVIFIAACIETDIFLPALPDMLLYFGSTEEQIQSLITWNFVGICLAGPFYGPLSDVFGRRRPLLFALGLFLAGSVLTLLGSSLELMLWGRLLQGLGSGGCFTLGTAIIFDRFQEQKAVQAINKLNTIFPFIIAVAPLIGGYLNQVYGFRSNFIAIALFVLASFLICLIYLQESLIKEKRASFCYVKILRDFKRSCSSLAFWQVTVILSLIFAGYIAFLSGSAVLFVMELGVSKQMLPFFQLAILAAWLVASLTNHKALQWWGYKRLKIVAAMLIALGGLSLMGFAWLAPHNPYLPTVAMVFFAFGANWINGLYFPEGMEIFPDIKGVTASLLTSCRLLISAGVVGLASVMYNGTIYPLAATIAAVIVIILPTILCYERARLSPRLSGNPC